MSTASRQSPRLVTRAVLASFLTVVLILVAVFVLISVEVRARVRQSVTDNLAAAQDLFAEVESRREQDTVAKVSTLAESPTLKAALDTWQIERRAGGAVVGEAMSTVQREVIKIATRIGADVLLVLDPRGDIVASAGPRAASFPPGPNPVMARVGETENVDSAVVTPHGPFRLIEVPLEVMGATVGTLALGTALDGAYASQLARLARADSAIVINDRVWATTLPIEVAQQLRGLDAITEGSSAILDVRGESWAVRRVNSVGAAAFFALASIDTAAADATRNALKALGWIAIAALALGGFGSVWLARTITRPIDRLSASATSMSAARRFTNPLPATGTSRELDALTNTFNALMQSVAEAEAETQAAYLGAIRALAAALDARDPYTAGHSERVSTLSVEMGRALRCCTTSERSASQTAFCARSRRSAPRSSSSFAPIR